MNELQQCIHRGMELLEKQPGWREKVDLATLDMGNVKHGLLEQIFGGYRAGLKALGLDLINGCEYGFDIQCGDDDDGLEEWGTLTDAWIEALEEEVAP